MKRLLAVTVALATMAAVIAVAASGHASSAASARTLVVTARATSLHTAGTGAGAVTTFTDDLYSDTRKVGRDQVTCVATGPASFLECYATDVLPKGQVESVGPFDPVHQSRATVGIVGGTGAYHAARGTIAIKLLSQTKSTYTYHFGS